MNTVGTDTQSATIVPSSAPGIEASRGQRVLESQPPPGSWEAAAEMKARLHSALTALLAAKGGEATLEDLSQQLMG